MVHRRRIGADSACRGSDPWHAQVNAGSVQAVAAEPGGRVGEEEAGERCRMPGGEIRGSPGRPAQRDLDAVQHRVAIPVVRHATVVNASSQVGAIGRGACLICRSGGGSGSLRHRQSVRYYPSPGQIVRCRRLHADRVQAPHRNPRLVRRDQFIQVARKGDGSLFLGARKGARKRDGSLFLGARKRDGSLFLDAETVVG